LVSGKKSIYAPLQLIFVLTKGLGQKKYFIMLGKIRTLSPQIRSLMLYPFELQALV